jgi:hypothetical protein
MIDPILRAEMLLAGYAAMEEILKEAEAKLERLANGQAPSA